jgi:nucleotide-binding universal stress UspA family protein
MAARVIVGVSGSLASLAALRRAVHEARVREAELVVVFAYPAARGGRPETIAAVSDGRLRVARRRLAACIEQGLGGLPTDLVVREALLEGVAAGPALIAQVRGGDDLIVVGATTRRAPGLGWRRVGDYCTTRATCAVLTVPTPELARVLARGSKGRLREIHRQLAEELRADADLSGF